MPAFLSPLSNQCFAYAHSNCLNCFLLWFCWFGGWFPHCSVALLVLNSDGLHRRRTGTSHPGVQLGSPAPSDGALFPQRPKLVCFREDIFRSCRLAGGRTFFLNRRAHCNRIPLFSFVFFYRILSFFFFFQCHLVSLSLLPSSPCVLFLSSVSLSVSLFCCITI